MKRILLVLSVITIGHTTLLAQRPSGKPKTVAVPVDENAAATGDKQNVFPEAGFVGIGILTPGAPLEIKKAAGNTRNKNILLKLSNEWASGGQNEPSIMFSNAANSSGSKKKSRAATAVF